MRISRIAIVMALALFEATAAFADEDLSARIGSSREAVGSFAGALQQRLMSAMADGGPAAAVDACRIAAPDIAAAAPAAGWRIGRTSLKPRNPANAPDAWELAVLNDFEGRKAAGEDPGRLERAEFVGRDGRRTFRYLKAIPTQPVCTVCHGGAIAPAVAAALDRLYPQDRARGYDVGDIRGAFSITQPAPQASPPP
ncbi:MAG: DUF3365 domain-containing protein [Acidobacteriota bacterium]|nr:DUF3365 domain-containing protein [Acidobacteriota bacterium]